MSSEVAADLLAGGDGGLLTLAGWPHADTLDGVRAAFESDDAEALPWLIVLRAGRSPGERAGVIGDLGWKGAPGPDGGVEIGYGIAIPYRRHGYATEAVAALLGFLDQQPDVRVIRAEALADNAASRGVLERLGFEIDRLDGAYVWYERSGGGWPSRARPAMPGPGPWAPPGRC